jgi:hypothetical protein
MRRHQLADLALQTVVFGTEADEGVWHRLKNLDINLNLGLGLGRFFSGIPTVDSTAHQVRVDYTNHPHTFPIVLT